MFIALKTQSLLESNDDSELLYLLKQGDLRTALDSATKLLEKCEQFGEKAFPDAPFCLATANFLLGQVLEACGSAESALPCFQQAQQRFKVFAGETAAVMASITLAKQGDCLRILGQLESATVIYEECITHSVKLESTRQVAVVKIQLATVHMLQKRYTDALQGYNDALKLFQELDEPKSVASIWHQIGKTYKSSGDFEQAEKAYRQSISIENRQKNKPGEASSLLEMGTLYQEWDKPEQAVSFYRKAADIHMALGDWRYEGVDRSNIAVILCKLQRYEEARLELLRAIECKEPYGHEAEPWKTWAILHYLEEANNNPQPAQEARQQALETYLAYRRDGGENHEGSGQLIRLIAQAIEQSDTDEITQVLEQIVDNPEIKNKKSGIQKLQAVLAGERDLTLAEDESLPYDMAAELTLLLEQLTPPTAKTPPET